MNLKRVEGEVGKYVDPMTGRVFNVSIVSTRIFGLVLRPEFGAHVDMPKDRTWLALNAILCAPNADYVQPEQRATGDLLIKLGRLQVQIDGSTLFDAPVLTMMDLFRAAQNHGANSMSPFVRARARELVQEAKDVPSLIDAVRLACSAEGESSDGAATALGLCLNEKSRWAVTEKRSLFIQRVGYAKGVLPLEVSIVAVEACGSNSAPAVRAVLGMERRGGLSCGIEEK